jgi:hypothetical protein
MSDGMAEMISNAVLKKLKSENMNPEKFVESKVQGATSDPDILDITLQKVDHGVLSAVYCVEITYGKTTKEMPPSRWILKICREDLDLRWMFRKEEAFYTHYGPKLASDALPFDLVTALSTSEEHIILEFVNDATCHNLTDGCPLDKIEFLIHAMASWHAQCWGSDAFHLNHSEIQTNPPGMGQRLSPLQKEHLFVTSWKDTLSHMDFADDPSLHEFSFDLCSKMESLRLRDIHDAVHKNNVTCIHGDYHIANWLFPKDGSKPVLIDWTVWGYGNPMVDFAFFLVVSTNDQVVSNLDPWLEGYINTLKSHNPGLEHLSMITLQEWLGWALLCQWMVLVAYDAVCRDIANAETDPIKKETQLKHFNNVNRRALLSLKAIGALDFLKEIPHVTEEESKEAELYSKNTPLAI